MPIRCNNSNREIQEEEDGVEEGFVGSDSDKASSYSQEQIVDPDSVVAFNNRRRMAWLALLSMIFFMFTIVFNWPLATDPERLKILQEPIVWFFLSMTAVIGSYMGFTSQIMGKMPGMKIGGGNVSHLLGISRNNNNSNNRR